MSTNPKNCFDLSCVAVSHRSDLFLCPSSRSSGRTSHPRTAASRNVRTEWPPATLKCPPTKRPPYRCVRSMLPSQRKHPSEPHWQIRGDQVARGLDASETGQGETSRPSIVNDATNQRINGAQQRVSEKIGLCPQKKKRTSVSWAHAEKSVFGRRSSG